MDTSNELHDFRSVSYHHILVACKDLAAATKLTTDFNEDLRTTIGAVQTPDSFKVIDGDHVVMINGFTDGETFIRDAEWETMFAPPSKKNQRHVSTTMALEGEMTIVEPKGFSFLEAVNNVSKKLKVDNVNITWVLKTVFIGPKMDNSVGYIANVKPLLFSMYDLQSKFDVVGSEYYVKFIGISNGNSKLPGFNNTTVASVSMGTKKKLGDTITELQTQLNANYTSETDKLIERCKADGLELQGRKLVYEIVLHGEYANYDMDNVQLSQRGNIDTSGNITFPKNASIEQMIHNVLRSSKQVGKDASKPTGEVDKIFKVFGSTKHSGDDTGTTTVRFDIHAYDVPKSTSDGATLNNGKSNAIEYDYMYTGKNIDVLDFDMKMEMGMGLLQLLTVNNTVKNTHPVVGEEDDIRGVNKMSNAGASGKSSGPDNTKKLVSINVGTILPSKKYDELSVIGNVSEGTAASFDSLLSKHSQLETLGVSIKVLGNPAVLNDLNITPDDIPSGKTGGTPFGEWLTGPPLVKVNVSIPANPNALVVEDKFSKEFWYKGFYRVISTKQQFVGGIFTQVHDMLSMELEDPIVVVDPKDGVS